MPTTTPSSTPLGAIPAWATERVIEDGMIICKRPSSIPGAEITWSAQISVERGLLGMAVVVWDEPASGLRRRADLVLTKEGRGPVRDRAAFALALRRTADLLEAGF